MSLLKTIFYFAITLTCFILLAAVYYLILAFIFTITTIIKGIFILKESAFNDKEKWTQVPGNRELSDVYISH